MYFYEVWVASQKVHSKTPLTYSYKSNLFPGEIVQVPVRQKASMGVVVKQTTPELTIVAKIKSIDKTTGTSLPKSSMELLEWMQAYYPAPSGVIVSLFLPSNLPKENLKSKKFKPIQNTDNKLTADQAKALKTISESTTSTVLLHGDTGTGKTRVYIELAKQVIADKKSVIVLTPEIGLTKQLVESFSKVFDKRVLVLHSNLGPAKRNQIWYEIVSSQEPLIVIGPRSALFAPLSKIGLVVVDEAHDQAYKQEQAPYYQATRVGPKLAQIHGAKCIFGTATPSVSDYFVFKEKASPIIRMDQPATGKVVTPKITVVNLKDRESLKSSPVISNELIDSIKTYISNGQQALLFLNRRGSARVILCQNCGWQATCPKCDIAMIYHADHHILRCHTCGFKQNIMTSCPACKSSEIIYHTPGTKSLEEEARRLFPDLSIRRFDSDNLTDEKLEKHFPDLVEGKVDIIIGTQLITKGLDLPKLGVVGIINADTSLNLPDYTSEERTFQQLSQVIGRVGRHNLPSDIIIQTYNPSSNLMKLVVNKDWPIFLDTQLKARQQFGFPPYSHLLQLRIARASQASAQAASQKLISEVLSKHKSIKVRGPSPQLHEKLRGKYHWQVIVSSNQRGALLEVINQLPSGWQYNIDPANLM